MFISLVIPVDNRPQEVRELLESLTHQTRRDFETVVVEDGSAPELSSDGVVREYADRALSLQDMSDLLWAANGVNRPASGKRTAPSAMDRRDIQIYVLTDKGVYLYVPEQSLLQPVAEGDHRQDVRGNKPAVNLVLVAEDGSSRFADTDAGYVSQNIFLACTSLGLATVSCGSMDEPAFRKACRLNDRQRIILFHPVGYPR